MKSPWVGIGIFWGGGKLKSCETGILVAVGKCYLREAAGVSLKGGQMKHDVTSMSNANVGKAFNAIAKGIGRGDLGEILFNWNESQLNEDGSNIIGYPGRDPTELIMDILRQGHHVEVLKPVALRREIQKEAELVVAAYK